MPRIQGRIDPDGAIVLVTVMIGGADENDTTDVPGACLSLRRS